VTGNWKKLRDEELHIILSEIMIWACRARALVRNEYKIIFGMHEGKRPLGNLMHR
jgi:hypothetical protein